MARFNTAALQRAAIHIDGSAAAPVRFAAEELRHYLRRMTGRELPIVNGSGLDVALVIDTQALRVPPKGAGAWTIAPEPERISLSAISPRALLSAAYALLEQLGCRWSLHGAEDEVVPRLGAAPVDLAPVHGTPAFRARGYASDIMTWHYTEPEHFGSRLVADRAFIDWMGKSGATTFFYIRHPFDTQLTIPELQPELERRGIDVEYGGHVVPLLLPRGLYGAHPDYFPAAPDGRRTDHGNVCTSNAAALETVTASAVQYVQQHPEMAVLHIWGADLWKGGWCHCPSCRPVSVQDQSLRVCNAVAAGLAAAGLTRPVCYLAYHDTLDPELTLTPGAGVYVEFAPRERCYGHALDDAACTTNRRYAAALERYAERFDRRVRVFEYYGDAILFFGCAVPLIQVITADLDYYQRLGVDGITMLQFGTYSLWAYPLNFVTFAAAAAGRGHGTPEQRAAYCARFGDHASLAAAQFAEIEEIMRTVVTYGDIRRPPRAPETAAKVLLRLEAALPRLARIAERLTACEDRELAAQAALVRFTRAVLGAVVCEIRSRRDGEVAPAESRYAEALRIVAHVERRFKGLWGAVDLPIIHALFSGGALDVRESGVERGA
jgi:hypothetical protein